MLTIKNYLFPFTDIIHLLFLLFLSLGAQQICAANVNDSTANTIEIQDAVSTPRLQPAENNEILSVLLNNNTDTTTLTVKADTVSPVTLGITAGMESAKMLNINIPVKNKNHKYEKWKVIGLYASAVVLNAMGDGLNNTDRKTLGHILNTASIGTLLVSPFLIQYEKKKWYWYLLTYTSLRLALFDATYNLTTHQPIDYIGSTAITDKWYRTAGVGYNISKIAGFAVGITIPCVFL
jgi:hypothetical protein